MKHEAKTNKSGEQKDEIVISLIIEQESGKELMRVTHFIDHENLAKVSTVVPADLYFVSQRYAFNKFQVDYSHDTTKVLIALITQAFSTL